MAENKKWVHATRDELNIRNSKLVNDYINGSEVSDLQKKYMLNSHTIYTLLHKLGIQVRTTYQDHGIVKTAKSNDLILTPEEIAANDDNDDNDAKNRRISDHIINIKMVNLTDKNGSGTRRFYDVTEAYLQSNECNKTFVIS